MHGMGCHVRLIYRTLAAASIANVSDKWRVLPPKCVTCGRTSHDVDCPVSVKCCHCGGDYPAASKTWFPNT